MTRRVLVTGASGFIGSHLVPVLLERGFEVHAVYRTGTPTHEDVTWHHADLLQDDHHRLVLERARPTHLLHLGWYVVPRDYQTSPLNHPWTTASHRLFRRAADAGVERIVGVGSCMEYEWCSEICHESRTTIDPQNVYAACKAAVREDLEALSASHPVSQAWARIFFTFGPREHPERLISSIIQQLLLRETATFAVADHQRDYLYVEDVASALGALMDSTTRGPVNIASGHAIGLHTLFEHIAARVGPHARLAWRPVPNAPQKVLQVVADITRLREECRFSSKFMLEEAIERTIHWWRRRLAGTAS